MNLYVPSICVDKPSTFTIASPPDGICAINSSFNEISYPGIIPVALLRAKSSVLRTISKDSPTRITLGTKPCTEWAFPPTTSKPGLSNVKKFLFPTKSTYIGSLNPSVDVD
ncbi:MAG: hypothetical protein WCJ38_04265 [Actinomycetes bacterium]